jgi:hypothetical protein
MEPILQEIEKALNAKLYYLAIVLAVTLPDICAALEASDGRTSSTRYKAWYKADLAGKVWFLTEDDCYSLRCGVVHQGQFGVAGSQYDRVAFFMPHPDPSRTLVIRGTRFGTAPNEIIYTYSAVEFCQHIIDAVRLWAANKTSDVNVQKNLPKLIQYRPNGMPPTISGFLIIA